MVASSLTDFSGLDHNEIAHKLIDAGKGSSVAENLANFAGLDHNEIAHKLIDAGKSGSVASHLESFTNLDASVARKLIDAGEGLSVIRHFADLASLDHNEIAHKLIDAGKGRQVAGNLKNFTNLDASAANKLIDAGGGWSVARRLKSFTNLDASVARKLIDAGEGWHVARHLENFTGLNHNEIAHKLIDVGEGNSVAENLANFIGLDHNEIAHKLIDAGRGWAVASNLIDFTGLDHNEIAHKIIDAGKGDSVAENLKNFTNLDASVARKLIDAGEGEAVARRIANFTGLDHNEIAHKLIDAGKGRQVAGNLKNFTGLDVGVASELLNNGYVMDVLQSVHAFGESASEIVIGQISEIKKDVDLADAVLEHLLDYGMNTDVQSTVLWACANHYSTAQKVAQLDLEALIGEEEAATLRAHIAKLRPELRGVANHNPYADEAGDMEHTTSSRPGTEFHRSAVEVDRRLRQPETDEDRELVATIQHAYDALREDVAAKHGEQYAKELFGGRGDKTGDAWPTYRRSVADYIAAMGGDINMTEVLERAARAFNQALSVDTNYYDKLFSEWDAKRIGEREFQEVFLGRDGVYAYVGRQAQLYARRRKLGMSSREAGGAFVEFPTYLVYPRGFRDELYDETKSAYLRSRIGNPQAAHYYDTGFTGTIPDDIMRVLGVAESDRDSRIRLLSANRRPRTVLGLQGDKFERDQIVNTIEHNVKDEESAEGLYETEDGRLEPYSRPTNPRERLAFRMTQLALHRHYYTRELKSTDPVNLGYEVDDLGDQREIRVDGSYSEAAKNRLKELFSSNDIGTELLQSATSLKVANPNDPYPDEAVFELSLPDDTEVIVKNVVSTKQQGPIDEFEALLLLNRLGIDAPKPIARVFASGQKGFVVMEKIYGESGRTIHDFFSKNDISEANQRELMADALSRMQEIAETVRRDTGLDKPWRLKDFIIEYDKDENGQFRITSMRPIDFERAKVFNPYDPHSVKLGQELDNLV